MVNTEKNHALRRYQGKGILWLDEKKCICIECERFDVRCSMLGAGCWMDVDGCWMLDVRCLKLRRSKISTQKVARSWEVGSRVKVVRKVRTLLALRQRGRSLLHEVLLG